MIKSIKIRLLPTPEQETIMFQSIGCKRFAYNWGLNRIKELKKMGFKYNKVNIRTDFNEYKQQFEWIKNVSAQVTANAFEDLDVAMKKFFKKEAKYPKFKTKKSSKQSFYVRYDAIKFKDNRVNMEKIGKVLYSSNYKIPKLKKYMNPTCSYDGKYWYLSLGFEQENQLQELTDESIGIDLGIKDLAIISNQEKPIKNINKSKKVKKLKKKLKRKQRQVSRKYLINKDGNEFIKTQNIIKLEKEIKLIYRKLNNIRLNHIHQATAMIVKSKPYRIVMEDLNIIGMMKNKHLSKAIQEQKFYEFIRQIEYKSKFFGIEFIKANKWFASSKTCSCCGHIKKDLRLSDRVYRCDNCGLIIDRDKNASINLSNYQLAN